MTKSIPAVSVDNLCFRYGQRQALNQVSFSLNTGITMLLGPNGAGKSTLFALLTQLYKLQQGSIAFDGMSLSKLGHKANNKLGVVFQQHTLDMDMSVSQNLRYFGALHGFNATTSIMAAQPLLERFELTDRLNDKVRHLNTGHKRRLEIVRALMHSPSILLLDEPSVGLDPASRTQLMQTVRDYCNSHPVCVLWSTHLLDEPTEDDQLLVLNQGQLLANGKCSELLNTYYQANNVAELFACLTADNRRVDA